MSKTTRVRQLTSANITQTAEDLGIDFEVLSGSAIKMALRYPGTRVVVVDDEIDGWRVIPFSRLHDLLGVYREEPRRREWREWVYVDLPVRQAGQSRGRVFSSPDWRDIPGVKGFQINKHGVVREAHNGRIRKTTTVNGRYLRVTLDGVRSQFSIKNLVYRAWGDDNTVTREEETRENRAENVLESC